MEKICKNTFIKELAAETKLPQDKAAEFFNKTLNLLSAHMKKGDSLLFTGFGSINIQTVGAKKGRNLITGEPITIPVKKKIKFVPSEKLAEEIQTKVNLKKNTKIDLTKKPKAEPVKEAKLKISSEDFEKKPKINLTKKPKT